MIGLTWAGINRMIKIFQDQWIKRLMRAPNIIFVKL